MKFFCFLFAFMTLAVASVSFADKACVDLFSDGLHPAAKQALLEADRNGYKVLVLRGDVAGTRKTVVLMGETHAKSKEHSDIGKNVLKEFTFRGLEGFESRNYWFSKIMGPLHDRIFKQLKKMYREEAGPEGSTIHDAKDQNSKFAEFERVRHELQLAMESQVSEGFLTREQFIEKAKRLTWTMPNGKKVNMADVLGDESMLRLQEKLQIDPSELPRAQRLNPIINVELESGKAKANWKENLTMLHFMTSLGTVLNLDKVVPVVTASCSAVACIGGVGDLGPAGSALAGAAMGAGGTVAYGVSARLSMESMGQDRNRLMVDNLLNVLATHKDQDTILVIVGENHVRGMKDLLEEKHHFAADYFALKPFELPLPRATPN